jgi:4-amino-4-deoxy-L-arabinose transferase-like glycosyltransferase
MAGRPHFLSAAGDLSRGRFFQAIPIFLLFIAALTARLAALGRYVTPDEAIWVYRSLRFREALLAGRWAETLVAGHPGVTTTWLGAMGMSAQMAVSEAARAAYDWLAKMAALTPENVEAARRLAVLLSGGRVAVALVNGLGIVAVYWLARRLWGGTAAFLAAVFLAFDPFLVGLSGLLHVDGLSATFAAVSLLSLLVSMEDREGQESSRRWGWLALAGAAAGLAVLSKTPTLLLLPVSGVALLWVTVRGHDRAMRERLKRLLIDGVVWGVAFLATVVLLYPALWVAPLDVVATVSGSVNRHLDEALRETFFMGEVAFDHGPLFYPVVLLWRLSPVVWLALIPALWWLIGKRRSLDARTWFPVALLLLWTVLFIVFITFAAKKFDRYILPTVPALLILAAVAWAGWARNRPRAVRWLLPALVGAQLLFWLAHAAYPLTAYNPLVGGGRTAVAVLPIGWGEGIGAAGRRLADTEPGATEERAIAGVVPSLAPFFPGQTLVPGVDDPSTADYVIVTQGGRQLDPAGVAAQTAGLELLATEHFGGLDQAWTYRNPSPQAAAVPTPLTDEVTFGERMALSALGQEVEDDLVSLLLDWRRVAPLADDERFTLRIVIQDEAGNVWAAQEAELLNDVAFYPPDWASDDSGTVRFALELPPGMPPATYRLALSLIDQRTAGQLPARTASGEFLGVAYVAGDVIVPVPADIVTATRMQIPVPHGRMWLDGGLQLLGAGQTPEAALAGGDLPLELFWHAPTTELPDGIQLEWTLQPLDGGAAQPLATTPLSRFNTGQWRVGETIHEKYRLPLPPPLPAGGYELLAQPLDAAGQALGPAESLGELTIDNIDRLYDVPLDVARPLLDDCFGETICLQGALLPTWTARPGQTLDLVLYWQALREPPAVYTAFLHVLNEAGEILLTADHWPGGLPSDIWDAGQVIEDRLPLALPADLPPGDYRLRLGLYNADDGRRLPLDGSEADHLILPWTLTVLP